MFARAQRHALFYFIVQSDEREQQIPRQMYRKTQFCLTVKTFTFIMYCIWVLTFSGELLGECEQLKTYEIHTCEHETYFITKGFKESNITMQVQNFWRMRYKIGTIKNLELTQGAV